jgi:hypothetical protein
MADSSPVQEAGGSLVALHDPPPPASLVTQESSKMRWTAELIMSLVKAQLIKDLSVSEYVTFVNEQVKKIQPGKEGKRNTIEIYLRKVKNWSKEVADADERKRSAGLPSGDTEAQDPSWTAEQTTAHENYKEKLKSEFKTLHFTAEQKQTIIALGLALLSAEKGQQIDKERQKQAKEAKQRQKRSLSDTVAAAALDRCFRTTTSIHDVNVRSVTSRRSSSSQSSGTIDESEELEDDGMEEDPETSTTTSCTSSDRRPPQKIRVMEALTNLSRTAQYLRDRRTEQMTAVANSLFSFGSGLNNNFTAYLQQQITVSQNQAEAATKNRKAFVDFGDKILQIVAETGKIEREARMARDERERQDKLEREERERQERLEREVREKQDKLDRDERERKQMEFFALLMSKKN